MPNQYDAYYANRKASAVRGERGAHLSLCMKQYLPVKKTARILDIGCGLGDTLAGLIKAGYADVSGVDISNEAVTYCESRGLNVVKVGGVADIIVEDVAKRYDFIIMSHVLEHITKDGIIETLQYVKDNLLAPEAGLFIQVPNAQSHTGCYWAYEDFTHHVLFTAGSLEFVLRTAGFSDVQFVDPDCTEECGVLHKIVKRLLLKLYIMNIDLWNWVTSSSYHRPSPRIYSYEIKAVAR